MTSRWAGALSRTRWACLPGVLVTLVLWGVTFVRWGDVSAATTYQIDWLWQSLGRAALRDDPWGSLAALHIQPPGLNALYAIDLAVTPDRHVLLLGLYLVLALVTVVLLVDALIRSGVPGTGAAATGLVFALLPSTVIYALWGYVVTPLAALATAAVWGVVLMRTRPVAGALVSSLSMLGLVLMRPSFAWFVLLVWCAALTVVLVRRRPRPVLTWALLAIWIPAALGVGVQAHYWMSFRLPVMSSWSGENLAKALWTSGSLVVTPGAVERAAADPCLAEMLAAYQEDRLNRWDVEAFRGLPACAQEPGLAPRGTAAWDSAIKAESGEANFNYADRLVASRKWTQLMSIIVSEHPQQLLRMALTTKYGPTGSGLGLYLSPSEDYPFVTPVRDALPTAVPMGVLSLVVGSAMWVLIVLGWVHALVRRTSPLRGSPAFWLGSGLLAFHLTTNVLLEYSENMRYRAEVEPVLLLVGVLALSAIWTSRPVADADVTAS